ncbi:MAG TPA: MarR family transcriptional regulator, partial [Opitutus sp.]|nr:MarR family transcriptional regulator [Opitutus sp.]
TPKGQALLETILPPHFKRMAALMNPLTETERKTLVDLLKKIRNQAAGMPAPEEPRCSAAS